jgi:hypothetical protein
VNASVLGLSAVLLLSTACTRGPERASSIGEAFVGPASLNIRKDIPTQAPTVITVKHGERLEILQRRRTFFRVRTSSGAEGWADERQLLAAADMQNLKRLAELAAKLPSQGAAVPRFGDLRVYTLPARESPSFITVKDKEKVEVVGHVTAARAHMPRTPLLPPAPKKIAPKKKTKGSKIPPVPMPKPPAPPADWQELSKTEAEPAEEPDTPPAPTDDWSLVRMADGEAGWALTRRLDMAIPDEVAQYAEGRRIVSYFSLGAVRDGGENKNIWLWTTIGEGPHAYDFDNFRVFIWSLRRHRYETSYIERNLIGFEPVTIETATLAGAQYPGFSVCFQRKDGSRVRREYALLTNVIRTAGERPCEAQGSLQDWIAAAAKAGAGPAPSAAPSAPAKPSLAERVKGKVRSWFGK